MSNAAKYTDKGGQIWLNAAQEEGEIVLRVRDNGIDIAQEMLPRVFDLFAQAPNGSKRTGGCLGIGLAMVGRLVQLHGGTVQAVSDGLGRGSEFVIRLPLLPATNEERDRTCEAGRPAPYSPSRRILIADDNEDLVEAVAQLLRHRGHEVCVAGDGPAALAAAYRFRPAVVFLDIELPALSGYEVARRLRQQHGLENVVLGHMRRRRSASVYTTRDSTPISLNPFEWRMYSVSLHTPDCVVKPWAGAYQRM